MDIEVEKDAVKLLLSQCCSLFSEGNVEKLSHIAVSLILEGDKPQDAYQNSFDADNVSMALVKDVCSALSWLFLETARNDMSLQMFTSFLKSQCSFSHEVATTVAGIFLDRKKELMARLPLAADRSFFSKLSGVEWKLDYCISSSEDRTLKEFMYHICFKEWISDVKDKDDAAVRFVCSEEELQDLVSRLKDACRSVERMVENS